MLRIETIENLEKLIFLLFFRQFYLEKAIFPIEKVDGRNEFF